MPEIPEIYVLRKAAQRAAVEIKQNKELAGALYADLEPLRRQVINMYLNYQEKLILEYDGMWRHRPDHYPGRIVIDPDDFANKSYFGL